MTIERRKYIVSGAAGFIGSHLVEYLINQGHLVVGLDNFSSGTKQNLKNVWNNKNFSIYNINLADKKDLMEYFGTKSDIDGIFHLAANARIQPSIEDPTSTVENNVLSTLNILEFARQNKINKIVYSASSSSYGLKNGLPCVETQPANCLNSYAVSKYCGEHLCKTWGESYGIKNVSLKYFNVYGPRSPLIGVYSPVVGLFFQQAFKGQDLTVIGDGEQKRDLTYVDDVVRANYLAMMNIDNVNGETVNIGTGMNYTINELRKMVQDAVLGYYDLKTCYIHVPARPAEVRETLADVSKAEKLLGWMPRNMLEDKIDDLVVYYHDLFTKE